MNLAEAFVDYLDDIGIATFGQDLFIGNAPSSKQVSNTIWWIETSGGNKTIKAKTGEAMKEYLVDVYCRSNDYEYVYDQLQSLEETLNCAHCVELDGYDVVEVEALTFPIDNDLDSEDRKVGYLQASLTVYKKCQDIS